RGAHIKGRAPRPPGAVAPARSSRAADGRGTGARGRAGGAAHDRVPRIGERQRAASDRADGEDRRRPGGGAHRPPSHRRPWTTRVKSRNKGPLRSLVELVVTVAIAVGLAFL